MGNEISNEDAKKILHAYLRKVYAENMDISYPPPETDQVTALIYYFRKETEESIYFPLHAAALMETWRHCGLLKSVMVVNKITPMMLAFSKHFANLELQEEPTLIPGDIDSMSIDCNARLYKRFSTKYVLIVQDDGFPLRSGIKEFLKGWDFIGASTCRPIFHVDLATRLIHYNYQNGGFSLRTRRCCKWAAYYWRKKYSDWNVKKAEDVYYTRFLPRNEWLYRLLIRPAPSITSAKFCCQIQFPLALVPNPFGFHMANSFVALHG